MEEKLPESSLPPSYMNLGYDAEPVAGPSVPPMNYDNESTPYADGHGTPLEPSAPQINEDGSNYGDGPTMSPMEAIPPPKYEEDPGYQIRAATAPAENINVDPRILQCTPSLVFEDIYEACVQYVKSHCCYSSRFARQMKLTEINNGCAYHYSLESFGEKRETASDYVPYRGGLVDGPSNGRPPSAWEMYVSLPTLFKDGKEQFKIPHTETVETCSRCNGRGKVTCSSCSGRGTTHCWSCSGSGRRDGDRCSSCSGRGRNMCYSCWGSGRKKCSRCDGEGKIKRYRVLIVTWTNHPVDFVSNVSNLPQKKIMKADGETLITEERGKLSPITNCPDNTVNVATYNLLQAHENSFPHEMIRKQRHFLRVVPFTIAKYKWKDEEGEFYIYGKEKKVYFESYPTSCCCICC